MLRALALRVLVAVLASASLAAAQNPTFEVASIKPNRNAGAPPGGIRPLPNGRLNATNVTLDELLRRAYRLHESQLIGGPAWMKSDRFDVVAAAGAAPARGVDDVLLMLRSLLLERFRIDAALEKRELPAYMLTHARPDRSLGPNLRPSTVDCAKNQAGLTPNSATLDADGWPPCGIAWVYTTAFRTTEGTRFDRVVKHAGTPMSEIALAMMLSAGRPVVDGTGLTGLFDANYQFESATGSAPAPLEKPDLFTAVREQLGLRLEARRTDVDVLVVHSAGGLVEN